MKNTLPTPRKIVCFGDSNTWGYVPNSEGDRFDANTRWPGVLQQHLGANYTIIEEALNGRTTVWDDPMKPNRNGSKHLPSIIESHTPIDLVIIALGVNDLKHHFRLQAVDIALGIRTLAEIVITSGGGRFEAGGNRRSPDILLLAPALPVKSPNPLGHKFDGAEERGRGIGGAIAEVAAELHCPYLDANDVVTIPPTDGIHLDEDGHMKLGTAVAELVITNDSIGRHSV